MKILLRWGAVTTILAATACSPVNYERPITTLGTAINDTFTTISALDKKMTDARNDQSREELVDNSPPSILQIADGSCLDDKGCSLSINKFDDKEQKVFPATTVMPKTRIGMAELKRYTDNLQAIVSADTASKVTASVNATLGSAIEIETALNKITGQAEKVSEIAPYSQPTGRLIGWLFGIYVDNVKVSALRKATTDADPIIQRLAKYHAGVGFAAKAFDAGAAAEKLRQVRAAYETKSNDGTLTKSDVDAFVKAAQAYDGVLKAGAAKPLAAFADAHEKLTRQLNGNGDINMLDVMKVIEEVKLKANTFKEILTAFEDVS